MPDLIFGIIGTVLALIAASAYIWSIFKGQTRPHRVTWGVWTLAGILGLWASHEGGAGIGLMVAASFVLLVTATFLISLLPKYGKPGGRKTDYLIGAIAITGLVAWQVLDFSPGIAVTIAIVADTLAMWPTLREAWLQPETEELRPWVIGAVAEIFGLAALANYSYAASAYSWYILLGNLAIILALIVQGRSGKNSPKHSKAAGVK